MFQNENRAAGAFTIEQAYDTSHGFDCVSNINETGNVQPNSSGGPTQLKYHLDHSKLGVGTTSVVPFEPSYREICFLKVVNDIYVKNEIEVELNNNTPDGSRPDPVPSTTLK